MLRIQGYLVTIFGCMISLVSFCFLPYLVVPHTSFTFTGLQLLFLGPRIPLPHYFSLQITYPVVENIPGVLQNDSFVWMLVMQFALMGIFTAAQRWDKGFAWGNIVEVGLTFFFSLCSLASNVAAGFDFLNARTITLSGVVHGS